MRIMRALCDLSPNHQKQVLHLDLNPHFSIKLLFIPLLTVLTVSWQFSINAKGITGYPQFAEWWNEGIIFPNFTFYLFYQWWCIKYVEYLYISCAEIISIFRKFRKKINLLFILALLKKTSITFDNPYDKIILKKILYLIISYSIDSFHHLLIYLRSYFYSYFYSGNAKDTNN